MRKTKLAYMEAIAIRWDCIPDENKAKKAYVFHRLRDFKDLCAISESREMMQENGKMKGVRCIVVHVIAFSSAMQRNLQAGNYYNLKYMHAASPRLNNQECNFILGT